MAEKKRFKAYPSGYLHIVIDIADVQTAEGKLHLYVGIDRTSKFAFARLHAKADRPTAVTFLEALIKAVPYDLHTMLTDNPVLSLSKGASNLPTCRATATDQPHATASTASIRSAASRTSSTASPSRTIRGPMARTCPGAGRGRTDEPHHQGRHR